MKTLVLLSLIALSLGTITQLEISEGNLFSSLINDIGDSPEAFMEFLGQVMNQPNFISNIETVWNETMTGQRNTTNMNNLIQESNRIFGENFTLLLQDYLQVTLDQNVGSASVSADIQKLVVDLGLFLFPGDGGLNPLLRDSLQTLLNSLTSNTLNLTDAQNVIKDILDSYNIDASDYQSEIQQAVQVIYNHYFAPPNYTYVTITQDESESEGYGYTDYDDPTEEQERVLVPLSNTDIFELINNLFQTFDNNTNLQDVVVQDVLQIWNQSLSSQIDGTLITTLISNASSLLVEDFTSDEDVIQDAVQTIDEVLSLSTANFKSILSIPTKVAKSLLKTYDSSQGFNASAFSASPIGTSVQLLIQGSVKLLGNATGFDSVLSESLQVANEVLSSGHFNITDIIPVVEDAFELVGNDTEYAGIMQGFVQILNNIASGQPINVADLAIDIEEAFSDIAFGNSSYFNDAIQDLVLIIQGQVNSTTIFNFAVNAAQVLAEVTGESGPIDDGINIIDDLTSGNIDFLNLIENIAELVGDLTGFGNIIQNALQVVSDVESGNGGAFLKDVLKVIEDVTGFGILSDLSEDVDMVEDGAKLFEILTSSGSTSGSHTQELIELGLEIFGTTTNTQDLTSDLVQALEDINNEEDNFGLIAVDGANIAHDLKRMNSGAQNQGNMKTIVEDALQTVGMSNPNYYYMVIDAINAYNNFTSGNLTKEVFVENVLTLIEDVQAEITSENLDSADYEMHDIIASVFQIMNDYNSGQLTSNELIEELVVILGDALMLFDSDIPINIPLQNVARVLNDYISHDIPSLVEDTLNLMAFLNIEGSDALILSQSIATNIAIDQYASNNGEDAMVNTEDGFF